jgi:hypothetical protein
VSPRLEHLQSLVRLAMKSAALPFPVSCSSAEDCEEAAMTQWRDEVLPACRVVEEALILACGSEDGNGSSGEKGSIRDCRKTSDQGRTATEMLSSLKHFLKQDIFDLL